MPQTAFSAGIAIKRLASKAIEQKPGESTPQAIQRIILKNSIPFEAIRVVVAVWLYERLTGTHPTVAEIAVILSDESLKDFRVGQTTAAAYITSLSHAPAQGQHGILIKPADGDTVALSASFKKNTGI